MSFMAAMNDQATFGGGYDVVAQTSPLSPVRDMRRALARSPDVDRADFTATAAQSYVPVEARQPGRTGYAGYVVRGLDAAFAHGTTYSFATWAKGYHSDRQVWSALAAHPGLAVVDSYSVPRRVQWGTTPVSDFRLKGLYLEDKSFRPVPVEVRDGQSGRTIRLKVIGVLSDSVPFAMVGLSTSQRPWHRSARRPRRPCGTSGPPPAWTRRRLRTTWRLPSSATACRPRPRRTCSRRRSARA
jgi:hypothetical protein